jgi:hypothetical protein
VVTREIQIFANIEKTTFESTLRGNHRWAMMAKKKHKNIDWIDGHWKKKIYIQLLELSVNNEKLLADGSILSVVRMADSIIIHRWLCPAINI